MDHFFVVIVGWCFDFADSLKSLIADNFNSIARDPCQQIYYSMQHDFN